jgi:hypothetical protein
MAKLTKAQQAELDGLKAKLKATQSDVKTARTELGTALVKLKTSDSKLKEFDIAYNESRARELRLVSDNGAIKIRLAAALVRIDSLEIGMAGIDQELGGALFANAELSVANSLCAEKIMHYKQLAQRHHDRAVTAEELAKSLSTENISLKIKLGSAWLGVNPGAKLPESMRS